MDSNWLLWIVLFTIVCDGICMITFRKKRFVKYIPSAICLIGIGALAIRFEFFAKGYSGIADIVIIMILGISLAVSLAAILIAILADKWVRR